MTQQHTDLEIAHALLSLQTGTVGGCATQVEECRGSCSKMFTDVFKPITRDMGTQTDEYYCTDPNVELMEETIKTLSEEVHTLEDQLKDSKSSDKKPAVLDNRQNTFKLKGVLKNKFKTKYVTSSSKPDLVPIGDGNAMVPARILKHLNNFSYTAATRKVLSAVFPRRVLATHSLTGRCSPAFPGKPAKQRLDPTLVNDVVQTITDNYQTVTESMVRSCITTKCADESKRLKQQQVGKKKTANKHNEQNIPPTTSESKPDDY